MERKKKVNMPKFYIQSGTFRTIISRPNLLQALIETFNRLEKDEIRQNLDRTLMVDQRGFVFDLITKQSKELLDRDYIEERKNNGKRVIISCNTVSVNLSVDTNKTLYFKTEQVIKMVKRLNSQN